MLNTGPDPRRWGLALALLLSLGLALRMAPAAQAGGARQPSPGPRAAPASLALTVGGAPLRVHALPTGEVRVKASHHTCETPEDRHYVRRFLRIVLDRDWAAPMPVWAYAIEHPEGLFLVDAGATPAYRDPASWAPAPASGRLVRSFIELDVQDDETVPARLNALGLSPAAVRAVVLTHQHVDHTAAVPALPGALVWTSAAEDAMADKIGAMSWRWRPPEAQIRHVDQLGQALPDGLGPAHPLTEDGALLVIHTPGHTPGSTTLRLRADQGELWFTGDAAFAADQLSPSAPTAGIHTDIPAVRRLHAQLAALQEAGALILPAHDPTVPDRLRAFGGATALDGQHKALEPRPSAPGAPR
jgi:glyoxylase-like metal-dependent hydrolase (beta-lactamase superfamily II)